MQMRLVVRVRPHAILKKFQENEFDPSEEFNIIKRVINHVRLHQRFLNLFSEFN